jgi:hypothetical protein
LGNGVKKKMSDEKRKFRKNEIINVNELDEQIRRLVDNELADGIGEPISFL